MQRTNGQTFIVSAARTPIGKFGGALSTVPATELGGVAIRAAVERAGLDPATRRGRRRPDGPGPPGRRRAGAGATGRAQGRAPGRRPAPRPSTGSAAPGLKAIMLAASEIRAGDAELVIAGGMESMNGAPYVLPGARFGLRLGNAELIDSTVKDGLWCAIEDCHMGTHAERVAISEHVSREDQDAFALASHQKAIAAIDAGRFDAEMAPVTVRDAKGRETVVTTDEGPRRDSTAEALAKLQARLRPARRRGPRRRDEGRSRPATPRHHGRCGRDGRRQRARRRTARPEAARPDRRLRPGRGRPEVAVPRARSRASAGCSIGSSCRSRPSTSSRSTRRSPPRPSPTGGRSASTGTRSTSTAARSRSATRSGRAARGSSRRCSTSWAAGRAATASRRCAWAAAARSRWPSSASD